MEINSEYLLEIVQRAISEDVESGDVTCLATIDPNTKGKAIITAKQDGVISGLDVAALAFYCLDEDCLFETNLIEGSQFESGDTLVEISGSYSSLFSSERTALNFLMQLSGIATRTSLYVKLVSHTKCRILDTRKTTPGLRLLQKRAVHSGGGTNHRIGLYDMILIKENHITAAGGIRKAIEKALEFTSEYPEKKLEIEVETESLKQIKEAVNYPIQRLMLDNFSVEQAKKAVSFIKDNSNDISSEISGNIRLENVKTYAETGVDYISVGALTHSAPSIDLSMKIEIV